MDAGEPQPSGHLVHGADGAKLLPLDALPVLGEHQRRIFLGQLHQTLLLPLLWDDDLHLLTPAASQPLADDLLVVQRRLHPQLPGDEGRAGVELLHKAGENLPVVLRRGDPYMEMIPPDEAALPHKEHLHHRVPLVPGEGDDVPVLHALAGDLLLLGDLFDAG